VLINCLSIADAVREEEEGDRVKEVAWKSLKEKEPMFVKRPGMTQLIKRNQPRRRRRWLTLGGNGSEGVHP
jgi:hypothetical protein